MIISINKATFGQNLQSMIILEIGKRKIWNVNLSCRCYVSWIVINLLNRINIKRVEDFRIKEHLRKKETRHMKMKVLLESKY